jgi:hypothetical protein
MGGCLRVFASSVVAFAVLAIAPPSAASAAPPELKETIAFSGVEIFDPCTNESFLATGVVKISLKTSTSHGGVTHFGIAITSKAKGAGLLTGTKYVFVEGDHEHANRRGTPPDLFSGTLTAVTNVRINARGKLPDFSLHIQIHLTVNANGEPTATVVRQRIECGGDPLAA